MLVEVVEERLLDLLPGREDQEVEVQVEIPGLLALLILAAAVAVAINLAFRQQVVQAAPVLLFLNLIIQLLLHLILLVQS
jgi:hypothetical protein